MKSIVGLGVALCGWALSATVSVAQNPGVPGGQFRPAISPYLNLNRGGDPAINYYGLVRPQVSYNKAIQKLGTNVNALEATFLDATSTPSTSQTGNFATFGTQGPYFGNSSAFFANNGAGKAGNQLSFRPNTVAGSNTIAGGNQSRPVR